MTSNDAPAILHLELLSDSTFSRGEGTAGAVDTEVEHDESGLPFIGGKTVRGLLRDAWLSMCDCFPDLHAAADRVLGRSRCLDESCRLRFGDALLPEPLRRPVRAAAERTEKPLSPETILAAFTEIRYQTAEDRDTGAPATTTLRSSRVVLRGFSFESRLTWLGGYDPAPDDLRLLALCALVTRHGGLLRNRGRGHLRLSLDGNNEKTRRLANSDPAKREA
ncbi:MAG TPA: RAMP superfamily protein [Actinobacteria bacterium]|nr:RAMP superfamily protein [Actinomycetota bacterium]